MICWCCTSQGRRDASLLRLLLFLPLLVLSGGCISMTVVENADIYYTAGPEPALQALDEGPVRAADRHLAAMERAVSLLEIGAYEESNAELLRTAAELQADEGDAVAGLLVNDAAGTYRGEYFERLYLHTLAMVNFLAMQEIEHAAGEAEVALSTIGELPCTRCRYPFTRYLAGISLAYAGHLDQADEVLLEAMVESPFLPLLEDELEHLHQSPLLELETGFAPPPVLEVRGDRELYLLLLIGRGPEKIESAIPLPRSHVVAWPRYVSRLPSPVAGAELQVAGTTMARSQELTNMMELATASLKARTASLVSKEVGKSAVQEAVALELGDDSTTLELVLRMLFSVADRADLRHWASLPATCQVLRTRLPDGVDHCRLVYTSPSGEAIDSELLSLPAAWQSGPLFVTRRMP